MCSKPLGTREWSLMGNWLPIVTLCWIEQIFSSLWLEMFGRNCSYRCTSFRICWRGHTVCRFFFLRTTHLHPSVRFFSSWVAVVSFYAKYGFLLWPVQGSVTTHTNTYTSLKAKYPFTFQNPGVRRWYSSSPSHKAERISEFPLHLCCWQLFSFLQYGEFEYEKSSFLKEILVNFVFIWFWGNKNSWLNEKGTRNIFLIIDFWIYSKLLTSWLSFGFI